MKLFVNISVFVCAVLFTSIVNAQTTTLNDQWYWDAYYRNTAQPRYNTGSRYSSYLRQGQLPNNEYTTGGYRYPGTIYTPPSSSSQTGRNYDLDRNFIQNYNANRVYNTSTGRTGRNYNASRRFIGGSSSGTPRTLSDYQTTDSSSSTGSSSPSGDYTYNPATGTYSVTPRSNSVNRYSNTSGYTTSSGRYIAPPSRLGTSTSSRSSAYQSSSRRSTSRRGSFSSRGLRTNYSTRNSYGNYSRYRQPRSRQVGSQYNSASDQAQSGQAVLTVRPLTIDRDFTEGNQQTTPVFQIGFSNRASRSSTTLPPVYELRKVRFSLQDRQGVFIDFSDFFLEVDGERVQFNRTGDLTTSIRGVRATSGESDSFDVSLGLRDTSNLPRRYGSLRLVVEDAEVVQEFSGRPANYRISGNRSSNFVSFFPTPGVQSGQTASVSGSNSVSIFGKNLSAGSAEKVLAIRLQANYDDMQINNLTVRDTLSNGSIDSWSNQIEVIDESTGRVLDSSRFTGGSATFNFRPAVIIDRGGQKLLSFRLHLSDPLRIDNQNTSFKLMVDSNDIDVYGSNGNNVTARIVNIDSETFTVSGATGGVSTSGSQPSFAATGSLNQLFRFRVNNPSRDYISLARMSFSVRPVESEFAGGSISLDDFELRQYANGQNHDVGFAPVQVGSNMVKFDHGSELTIPPGESFVFTLYAALDDLPGNGGYAAVQVLGDSGYNKGTLAQVKASGANFIWSDNSSSPHSTSSGDWLSGYRFSGLTSNTVVIR